jgi:hypothetical protein
MVQNAAKKALPSVGMLRHLSNCVSSIGIKALGHYMHDRNQNGDSIPVNEVEAVFTVANAVELVQDGLRLGYDITKAIASSTQRATWAHESVCQGLARVLNRGADLLENEAADPVGNVEMDYVRENARNNIIRRHERFRRSMEEIAREECTMGDLEKRLKDNEAYCEDKLQHALEEFDKKFPTK